jgi:glutaredoxin
VIKVFGADWCPMTNGTRKHLDSLGLRYEYVNVEKDKNAAQWLREQNGGAERKPTGNIGGTVLSEPSNAQLDKVLREQSLIE